MAQTTLLIVSPHLDDAVLSCADHGLDWQRRGGAVHVLTLFSDAGAGRSALLGTEGQPCTDGHTRMQRRRDEDAEAMRQLGFGFTHLGLVDAAFRGSNGADFPDLRRLWAGQLGPGGAELVAATAQRLRCRSADFTQVVAPLGVGGHVDHLIARQACEQAFGAAALAYYADMPYARAPWRWRAAQCRQAALAHRSWRWISPHKQQVLRAYASEMPLLFKSTPKFAELLLLPTAPHLSQHCAFLHDPRRPPARWPDGAS